MATERTAELEALQWSAAALGVGRFTVLGLGMPWPGFGLKVPFPFRAFPCSCAALGRAVSPAVDAACAQQHPHPQPPPLFRVVTMDSSAYFSCRVTVVVCLVPRVTGAALGRVPPQRHGRRERRSLSTWRRRCRCWVCRAAGGVPRRVRGTCAARTPVPRGAHPGLQRKQRKAVLFARLSLLARARASARPRSLRAHLLRACSLRSARACLRRVP